eukprot:m.102694 g.102694  ORF g.102694 m.102694 type:complete len:58 (-) comp9083_c2_seq7:676-849(-)
MFRTCHALNLMFVVSYLMKETITITTSISEGSGRRCKVGKEIIREAKSKGGPQYIER